MSTRSSIFFVEDSTEKTECHIYGELADREICDGRIEAVPLYMELERRGKSGALRLPAELAAKICEVLDVKPSWKII